MRYSCCLLYKLYVCGANMVRETIEDIGLGTKLDYKVKDKNVEKLFKERQDARVELLQESITDIQNMLVSRETLHNELLKGIDKLEMFIDNSMPKGSTPAPDLMKELLKKKIEMEELKVNEKLNFWKDQALLKKELREHMKEFRDMESKTSMIDNILDM